MSFVSTTNKAEGPRLAAIPRYLSALLSQGLVSGFHFVLNLVLVSLLLAADFGVYALVFVLAYTATAVSNALFTTPLQVFAPAASSRAARADIQTMLTTLLCLLLGVCLTLGLMGSWGLTQHGWDPQTMTAALCFLLAYVARQYSRSYGYARFDVIAVLIGDMTYVVVGGCALSLMFAAELPLAARDIFIVLAAANAVAVLVEISRLPRSHWRLISPRSAIRNYTPIWQQARWALLGSLTTLLIGQAHTAVVVALKNPAAYAPLAAGFVLFGPVRVLFQTIQNVVKPEMALAIAEQRIADAKRQMVMISALSVVSVLTLCLAMQAAWPWLNATLYQHEYQQEPMRLIVFLWGAITLIGALQNGPYTALQSLKLFRPLAMVTVFGALLGLILVLTIVVSSDVSWSLFGVLSAEVFVAIWVMRLVANNFRRLNADISAGSMV